MSQPTKSKISDALLVTDKLIEEIQISNRNYVFQDENKTAQRILLLVIFLAVMLSVLVVFVIQRSSWQSNTSSFRDVAREYVLQRYQVDNRGTITIDDKFQETLIDDDWGSFSAQQEGVKAINLVTQYCDGDWILGGQATCDYSFQTQFNNNQTTMTYAVRVEADKNGEITLLRVINSTGATTLLNDPPPFIKH